MLEGEFAEGEAVLLLLLLLFLLMPLLRSCWRKQWWERREEEKEGVVLARSKPEVPIDLASAQGPTTHDAGGLMMRKLVRGPTHMMAGVL